MQTNLKPITRNVNQLKCKPITKSIYKPITNQLQTNYKLKLQTNYKPITNQLQTNYKPITNELQDATQYTHNYTQLHTNHK